jgi:hypothetical protein
MSRTPIRKFAEQQDVSIRFLYKEAAAGRLVLTKVGSRTFVDDTDGADWQALAPKVNGTAGDIVLKVAEQKLKEVGKAVAEGQIDRAHAVAHLAKAARLAGLTEQFAT